MAKVRRANHRNGNEKPRWAPNGTGDDTGDGSDRSDWDLEDEQAPVGDRSQVTNGVVSERPPAGKDAGFRTPVRVDEIAVAAMALSEGLAVATRGLPETIESRRFRRDLDEAAATFRAVASGLEDTAGGLVRLAAKEGEVCGVAWGVCPEHGITLLEVGELVTCRVLSCYHHPEAPVERCPLPVAYRVVDAGGPALFSCAGHAVACRLHLETAVITLASDSLELL